MKDFGHWMAAHQTRWRRERVLGEPGAQGSSYPWILPRARWEEGLWPGLRLSSSSPIAEYLASEGVSKHIGANNLKSSWIACANLYFPFRATAEDRGLLAGFLNHAVSDKIETVDRVELEYAEEGPLHPALLLGETGGSRGSGQTSPDIAFLVDGGTGIVLTESKLTEHSFYQCSARTRKDKPGRPQNPDPERCRSASQVAADPEAQCHQAEWGRKYWERLKGAVDETALANLWACPAAFAGYQLFRQQALAEGYSRKYRLAVSAVAYDARNDTLVNSLSKTGIGSFPDGWRALFKGKSLFAAWTHQAWVEWVKSRDTSGRWRSWVSWIEERYAFAGPASRATERTDSDGTP